ncbi:3-dehydroquinate synthase [Ochromonadaceae sp. CCMP2298]|nr:3-dehydroquinate synthase [Ochromonadaceae sp. CCMP2298]
MFKLLALCTLLLSIAYGFKSPFKQRVSGAMSCAKVSDVVNVDLGDRSYPILIGQDLLTSAEKFQLHVTSKKALIVTNTLVGPLYADKVRASLEAAGVEVHQVTLPDGEEYKTMDVLMTIVDAAMTAKLDRKSTMIALGGGVVGDMCGFAAAIYQRGIRFLQIPTTLMAMVDSAVGGKTAVNHPLGKNMIGAFYQPEAVFIDTDTLSSLPDRELRSGIAEVVKYGLIKDTAFFEWLEQNMHRVVNREPAALTEIIRRSCENKAAVVAADEKEGGVRATLNLGIIVG